MYPPIWGPYFHDVLFFTALSYPSKPSEERQQVARRFVEDLFRLLPCPGCKAHAQVLLRDLPPALGSRDEFLAWCVAYHNQINQRTGKRADWDVEEAFAAFRERHFTSEHLTATVTAERKRLEDHRHIQKLQSEKDRAVAKGARRSAEVAMLAMQVLLVCLGLVAVGLLVHQRAKKNFGPRTKEQNT